jgi:hypothetical protein
MSCRAWSPGCHLVIALRVDSSNKVDSTSDSSNGLAWRCSRAIGPSKRVKLSLYLINYALRHENKWGSGGTGAPFWTSALVGGELSASSSAALPPEKRVLCNSWIGDWVSSRAGLDAVEQRKISCLCCDSNSFRPARNPSLYRLSYRSSSIGSGMECISSVPEAHDRGRQSQICWKFTQYWHIWFP